MRRPKSGRSGRVVYLTEPDTFAGAQEALSENSEKTGLLKRKTHGLLNGIRHRSDCGPRIPCRSEQEAACIAKSASSAA